MILIGVLRDQAFLIMTSSLVLKGSRLMGFCGPLGKTHTSIDIEYVVFTLKPIPFNACICGTLAHLIDQDMNKKKPVELYYISECTRKLLRYAL